MRRAVVEDVSFAISHEGRTARFTVCEAEHGEIFKRNLLDGVDGPTDYYEGGGLKRIEGCHAGIGIVLAILDRARPFLEKLGSEKPLLMICSPGQAKLWDKYMTRHWWKYSVLVKGLTIDWGLEYGLRKNEHVIMLKYGRGHAGDCTIYASLVNGNPTDGICTCGYGLSLVRECNWSEMYSDESGRKE